MKLVILIIYLFFVSCGVDNKKEGEVIARVGRETLTKENLLFLAGTRAGDSDFFSRTINNWVENKLLYLAAVSIGLDKDLQLMKERDLFYESLLISSYIKIQTQEKTRTTKKEVDLQVDALLDDISEGPKPQETQAAAKEKKTAPSPDSPTDYLFTTDQKRMSKKKREELKLKFNASNRNDTLGQMMKGMEKAARSRFNSASVFASSEDMSKVVVGIPLPSLSLEYLTGNDVFPLSSLIQIAGKWGSCKSTLAYEIFRWFYEFGGRSVLLDTESKYSPELCHNVMRSGDDDSAMIYNRCESLEDWQTRIQWYVDQFKSVMEGTSSDPGPGRVFPVVLGVDSIKAARLIFASCCICMIISIFLFLQEIRLSNKALKYHLSDMDSMKKDL